MSLGLCASLLLAGRGTGTHLGLCFTPLPLRENEKRKSRCALGFVPIPRPRPLPLSGSGRAGCGAGCYLMGCQSWGASEASLSFHKGDTGLEEKVTSPESRSKPRGPVLAR